MANVRIEGVAKQYAGRKILSGLSLELNDGECFTLLGPSGYSGPRFQDSGLSCTLS